MESISPVRAAMIPPLGGRGADAHLDVCLREETSMGVEGLGGESEKVRECAPSVIGVGSARD